MDFGDKILQTILDSLTVEELESLLEKKKNALSPKEMTEDEMWINHYKNEIIKRGILCPPKYR